MKYSEKKAPKDYVCGDCGAKGVKLWREYNTFLEHQEFRCAKCAMKYSEKTGTVNRNGLRRTELGLCNQIGWLVPAVPTEEEDTYWGLTSTPQEGYDWWENLPLTDDGKEQIVVKDFFYCSCIDENLDCPDCKTKEKVKSAIRETCKDYGMKPDSGIEIVKIKPSVLAAIRHDSACENFRKEVKDILNSFYPGYALVNILPRVVQAK